MYWFIYVIIFLFALLQTPILVDVLRVVFPERRIGRVTNKVSNFLIIILMSSFAIVGLSYYLLIYLPLMFGNPLYSFKGMCHTVFALWVWINMVGNYYLAVFIHPGADETASNISQHSDCKETNSSTVISDSKESIGESDQSGLTHRKLDAQNATQEQGHQQSPTEGKPVIPTGVVGNQPPGLEEQPKHGMEWNPNWSRYCKVCDATILYMDHHCPFTGNCTGLRNYSYFYLWLIYITIGLGYAVVVSFPYFSECSLSKLWWYLGLVATFEQSEVCNQLGPNSNITFPVIGGLWVCWNMLVIQTILLLSDMSTYVALKNLVRLPLFRFMWQRMRGMKFREPNSRLNVLLLSQRPNPLWFLVPVYIPPTNPHHVN